MHLKRLLAVKGIHFLATRFGSPQLRSWAFDEKYRLGHWSFSGDGPELFKTVQNYLRGGRLLMLGCGGATLLDDLDSKDYTEVLGVDLSEEALRLAQRFASDKVSFVKGDMTTFQPARRYEVILFSESLNYLATKIASRCLQRLSQDLDHQGVFVVTFAQSDRYAEWIEMIRTSFAVVEDRKFTGAQRHLLVFRGKS